MRVRPLMIGAALTLLASAILAQSADAPRRTGGATISGIVRDSVARVPLGGAWVQLVDAEDQQRFSRTVLSDSLGRFAVDGVADGRYTLGFFHPLLDSLGVEAPLHDVLVRRQRAVRMDLATPSPLQLREAICGARAGRMPEAVVIGVVRDARTRAPRVGATVIGDWMEYTISKNGVDRRRPRLVDTTAANGWFALCDVPKGGTMFLSAALGDESTDVIELQVPAHGFLRRELYLGSARTVATADSVPPSDTLVRQHRQRAGDGVVRGAVLAAEGNRRLAGAIVAISGSSEARANEQGEWTLARVPTGTRVLEVRAVGFYAERRAVDVVPDGVPVRVALSTFQAVLDTVKITAHMLPERLGTGFEQRRRSGAGHYLTPADIARRGAFEVTDLFRVMSGVRIGYASDTISMWADSLAAVSTDIINPLDRRLLMRGSGANWCIPTIYLNGLALPDFSADAVDNFLRPKLLTGVEVYSEATMPAEFRFDRTTCGVILFWTKLR